MAVERFGYQWGIEGYKIQLGPNCLPKEAQYQFKKNPKAQIGQNTHMQKKKL